MTILDAIRKRHQQAHQNYADAENSTPACLRYKKDQIVIVQIGDQYTYAQILIPNYINWDADKPQPGMYVKAVFVQQRYSEHLQMHESARYIYRKTLVPYENVTAMEAAVEAEATIAV